MLAPLADVAGSCSSCGRVLAAVYMCSAVYDKETDSNNENDAFVACRGTSKRVFARAENHCRVSGMHINP